MSLEAKNSDIAPFLLCSDSHSQGFYESLGCFIIDFWHRISSRRSATRIASNAKVVADLLTMLKLAFFFFNPSRATVHGVCRLRP